MEFAEGNDDFIPLIAGALLSTTEAESADRICEATLHLAQTCTAVFGPVQVRTHGRAIELLRSRQQSAEVISAKVLRNCVRARVATDYAMQAEADNFLQSITDGSKDMLKEMAKSSQLLDGLHQTVIGINSSFSQRVFLMQHGRDVWAKCMVAMAKHMSVMQKWLLVSRRWGSAAKQIDSTWTKLAALKDTDGEPAVLLALTDEDENTKVD